METYINFVRNHAALVRPCEGLLRTVTFFLPSRFHENGAGEITSEAALSASTLLTLLNDLILVRPPTAGAGPLVPRAEDRIGLLLTTISHTEVLLEKLAMRFSSSGLGGGEEPYGLILLLEALKAALKLALLRMKRQRAAALPAGAAFTADGLLLDGGRFYPSFGGGVGGDPFWGEGEKGAEEEQERRLLLQVVRGGSEGSVGGGLGLLDEEEGQEQRAEEEGGGGDKPRPPSPARPQWRRGRRTGRRFLFISDEDKAAAEIEIGSTASSSASSCASTTSPLAAASASASEPTSTAPSAAATVEDGTGTFTGRAFPLEEEAAVATARSNLLLAGEVLHILRPLLYAYLKWLVTRRDKQRQQQAWVGGLVGRGLGRLSSSGGSAIGSSSSTKDRWVPVLASALVDAASLQCTQQALGTQTPLRQCHQEELQRRRSLWCLYLLRTPIFESLTLPAAGAVDRSLGRVPLAGGFANYAFAALCYIQKHHFMTNRD